MDLVVWSLEGSYDLEILIKERADSMTIVFKAMCMVKSHQVRM